MSSTQPFHCLTLRNYVSNEDTGCSSIRGIPTYKTIPLEMGIHAYWHGVH